MEIHHVPRWMGHLYANGSLIDRLGVTPILEETRDVDNLIQINVEVEVVMITGDFPNQGIDSPTTGNPICDPVALEKPDESHDVISGHHVVPPLMARIMHRSVACAYVVFATLASAGFVVANVLTGLPKDTESRLTKACRCRPATRSDPPRKTVPCNQRTARDLVTSTMHQLSYHQGCSGQGLHRPSRSRVRVTRFEFSFVCVCRWADTRP